MPINHIAPVQAGQRAGGRDRRRRPGKRWPIWVEIDSNAPDPANAVLEIHPAVNFTSGTATSWRCATSANAAHESLEAPVGFRYYRDDVPSEQEAINARRPHFEELFSKLEETDITALEPVSRVGLHGRQRRQQHRARARDAQRRLRPARRHHLANGIPKASRPASTSRKSKTNPTPGEIARRVKGDLRGALLPVPVLRTGGPHASERRRGLRTRTAPGRPTSTASSPLSVTTGRAEAGAVRRCTGTGCWGTPARCAASPQRSLSENYKIVHCATDEIGMAESDVPTVIAAL